jgi:two-component system chemotaxis sensor kinase CheA
VMTVEAGGQVFGIPIEMIAETIRIPRDRISRLGHAEAIVLRESTVPLIRLTDILDLPSAGSPDGLPVGPSVDADARIVVVAAGDQSNHTGTKPAGALEVEGFGERMEIMLKPMEGLLAGVPGFAGTTLLGDGRVLIVLDLRELLRRECER